MTAEVADVWGDTTLETSGMRNTSVLDLCVRGEDRRGHNRPSLQKVPGVIEYPYFHTKKQPPAHCSVIARVWYIVVVIT